MWLHILFKTSLPSVIILPYITQFVTQIAAFRDYLRPRDAKIKRVMMLFNNHCPAHFKQLISLRNIHIEFLPPSTKETLQHMAQGIIRVWSSDSGRSRCVNCFNNINQEPATILFTLPILDALHFFSMCNNRLHYNCYVLSQSRLWLWCCCESECTNSHTYLCPWKSQFFSYIWKLFQY